MDVKQAIEFINIFRGKKGKITEQHYSWEDWNIKLDEVISLLHDLEKYREMWEELIWLYGWQTLKFGDSKLDRTLMQGMREIKEKYFPKPLKKVIEVEVEANDEIAVNWFIGWLHDTVGGSNEFNHDAIKVNIKEDQNDLER